MVEEERPAGPVCETVDNRRRRTLDLNLLKVIYPERLNIAVTDLDPREVRRALLVKRDYPPIDWIVHGNRLVTFRDLEDDLFEDACDQGSIDQIGTREWFESDDEVTKRHFVYLMGRCLSERMHDRLVFRRDRGYYFYKAGKRPHIERTISYQSYTNKATRKVVSKHGKARSGEGPAYYRHAAFIPRYVEIGGEWYLAVEPTYHFTRDGYDEYFYAADRLATIKLFEKNPNVRGQIGMWRSLLTEGSDLLRVEYPYVRFETVPSLTLTLPFGVPDELWTRGEDEEERRKNEEAQRDLFL